MSRALEQDNTAKFSDSRFQKEFGQRAVIRAVITNLDGVITGEKKGFNFPDPHQEELVALQMLKDRAIPVSICTAKFNYPVRRVIRLANLDGPHITDAGAVIIDPLAQGVISEHAIDNEIVREVLTCLSQTPSYIELYTADDYFIEGDQDPQLIEKRVALLEKSPIVAESLVKVAQGKKIIKIEPIVKDKRPIAELLIPVKDDIELSWTSNPTMPGYDEGIITRKGVSKKHAVLELAAYLNIPLADTLAIGYSAGHWDFMEVCGYIGVIGNNPKLQELAASKGDGKFTVGRSVDKHGFLDILNYFGLNKIENQ